MKNQKWVQWVSMAGLLWLTAAGCGTDDTAIGRPTDPGTKKDMISDLGDDMAGDMTAPDAKMDMTKDMPGPTSCTSSSDCTAPQICRVDNTTGDRTCGDPTGVKQPGDMCSSAAECQSNLCLNGVCAAPCDNDNKCPNGYSCTEQTIPLANGQSARFKVCIEQEKACLSDSACTSPERCVVNRTGTMVTLICQEPAPGGAGLGEACNMDTDCSSNLCLDNVCAKPCERPNDCSNDGSFVCEPTTVTSPGGGSSQVNVCKPKPADQCLSNSQCTSPSQCVASRGMREVAFECGTSNANGKGLGESCTQDSECGQNFCLNSVCAIPCQGNGDCAAQTGYTCELREVMLQNNNRDNVQVCVPPVVCDDPGDCKLTEACYVERQPSTLNTYCRTPNVANGALGQVCNQDTECASNLCYESRFGKVCSLPCDDNGDCQSAGYECRDATVKSSNGGGINTKICAPKAPTPCTSNDQCATGLTCAIVPNPPNNALESVCVPKTGRLATSVPCNNDDECSSRVCLRGTCAAPCTDTMQCGQNQACVNNTINKSNLSGSFEVCQTLQDEDCTISGTCTDGLRICGDIRRVNGDIRIFCQLPNSNGSQLGTSCMSDNDCREGLCHPFTKECSVGCANSNDCSQTAGQICTAYRFSMTNIVSLCTESCTDNTSCSNGNVCTLNGNVNTNDYDQICQEPNANGKDLGDTCATSNECLTGVCLTTQVYDPNGNTCTSDTQCNQAMGQQCVCPVNDPNCQAGKRCAEISNRCTRVCDDNTDCLGGIANNPLTSCAPDVFVQLPNGSGSKQVSMCAQP